jgi:hypothetical protein
MAIKSEQYQQVLDNIAAGDPMAAYESFTQLPFRDQMGLYMTPGVGDAIAYVESADFFDKAGTARQEGRYGDMIGSGLSGGIAAASMLPFAGSVVDAARVGGKTLERGIGSLMNRVNARMDDGIPGGGGGSRGGGSNTTKIQELENRKKELLRDHEAMTERMPPDEARRYYPSDKIDEIDDQIYTLSRSRKSRTDDIDVSIPKERSYRFNDLPEEVSTPVNLNVRKTGDSTFDVDAKSFRLDDFDVNNKSNAVVAKHFDDMGFDKNSIKVFDDDTTGFENMAKFKNMEPDPGSVKNYTFRLENGEEAIDKVQTFTVDGKPVARHYGSDPYIGGFNAYFIPNQGARGTKPFSKIEENKLKVSNKSQILNKLMRERETEYQYMTPKQLSALDARISKLKAELTGN